MPMLTVIVTGQLGHLQPLDSASTGLLGHRQGVVGRTHTSSSPNSRPQPPKHILGPDAQLHRPLKRAGPHRPPDARTGH